MTSVDSVVSDQQGQMYLCFVFTSVFCVKDSVLMCGYMRFATGICPSTLFVCDVTTSRKPMTSSSLCSFHTKSYWSYGLHGTVGMVSCSHVICVTCYFCYMLFNSHLWTSVHRGSETPSTDGPGEWFHTTYIQPTYIQHTFKIVRTQFSVTLSHPSFRTFRLLELTTLI